MTKMSETNANSSGTGSQAATAEPTTIPIDRLNEVIGQRNDLRTQIETLEAEKAERTAADQEADRIAATKRGEFETVINGLNEENAKLKAEAEEGRKIKAAADKAEAEKKQELLEKLPEDQRDTWKTADLTLLEAHVSSIGEPGSPAGVVTGKPGSGAEATGKATSAEIEANYANPAWRAANAHRL
jgi:small-conductance mechanosensitive channel